MSLLLLLLISTKYHLTNSQCSYVHYGGAVIPTNYCAQTINIPAYGTQQSTQVECVAGGLIENTYDNMYCSGTPSSVTLIDNTTIHNCLGTPNDCDLITYVADCTAAVTSIDYDVRTIAVNNMCSNTGLLLKCNGPNAGKLETYNDSTCTHLLSTTTTTSPGSGCNIQILCGNGTTTTFPPFTTTVDPNKVPDVCSGDVNQFCCSCCDEQGGNGCLSDQNCETAVCADDAFCCESRWDLICADDAYSRCPFKIPGTTTTLPPSNITCCSCIYEKAVPGCPLDLTCQTYICEADNYCCGGIWDSVCANAAAIICSPPTTTTTVSPAPTASPFPTTTNNSTSTTCSYADYGSIIYPTDICVQTFDASEFGLAQSAMIDCVPGGQLIETIYDSLDCSGVPSSTTDITTVADYNCNGSPSNCVTTTYKYDCSASTESPFYYELLVVSDMCSSDGTLVLCKDGNGTIIQYSDSTCTVPLPTTTTFTTTTSDECIETWQCNSQLTNPPETTTTTTFDPTGCSYVDYYGIVLPTDACTAKSSFYFIFESSIILSCVNGKVIEYRYDNRECRGSPEFTTDITSSISDYSCNGTPINCDVITVFISCVDVTNGNVLIEYLVINDTCSSDGLLFECFDENNGNFINYPNHTCTGNPLLTSTTTTFTPNDGCTYTWDCNHPLTTTTTIQPSLHPSTTTANTDNPTIDTTVNIYTTTISTASDGASGDGLYPDNNLSAGAIAGIIIGVILFIICCLFLIFYLCCCRGNNRIKMVQRHAHVSINNHSYNEVDLMQLGVQTVGTTNYITNSNHNVVGDGDKHLTVPMNQDDDIDEGIHGTGADKVDHIMDAYDE